MSRPKKKAGDPKKSYVDAAKFVAAWVGSDSVLEVSKKLHLTYANCRIRYNMMIKNGVELPQLISGMNSVGRGRLNVEGLNRMIKELRTAKAV